MLEDEERASSIMASREEFIWLTGHSIFCLPQTPADDGFGVSPQQAKDIAEKMINANLITKQTGAQGRLCNAVSKTYFLNNSIG